MTVLIVEPVMLNDKQLIKIWDDLVEAIEYETKTGFITRVVLTGWHRNGLPRYEPLPADELTFIEGRCYDMHNA